MIRKICFGIRYILSPFFQEKHEKLMYDKTGQDASDLIKFMLERNQPVMIARFGSVELQSIVDAKNKINFKNCLLFISGKTNSLGYGKSTRYTMGNNAGFFPVTDKNLDRFAELMNDCMNKVDVLGSWQINEYCFKEELREAIKVPLADLEPYFHANPWSEVLRGKKILVIHPFEDSIREQYANKRMLLFEDERVLPDFDLKTIKAVQTIANNPSEFSNWFDALEHMKNQIDACDFDIAIIGCGAYGFPLAAYVKSIGKKAIHLGGATQMFFGIKSKAWEDDPNFHYLINEHWIRPKKTERPDNYKKVEGGRYW